METDLEITIVNEIYALAESVVFSAGTFKESILYEIHYLPNNCQWSYDNGSEVD